MEWTRDRVWRRFVEAADTMRRQPGGSIKQESGVAIVRDYADAMAAEPTRDKSKWHPSFYRLTPPERGAIDRRQEVEDWVFEYLLDWPGEARVIQAMARAEAAGISIATVARLREWSRSTMYATRDRGLDRIVAGLIRDRVACLEAE